MELSSSSKGESTYSIIFVSGQIGEKYIRNNRGSGRKNLRCFPKCSNMGHIDRGFCGNEIHVVVFGKNISKDDFVLLQMIPLATSNFKHNFAELKQTYIPLPTPSVNDKLEVEIMLGARYLLADITKLITYTKSSSNYLCPQKLYIGTPDLDCKEKGSFIDIGESTRFVVSPKGWSYAWNSNKHCHNIQHVVRAYFMKQVDVVTDTKKNYKNGDSSNKNSDSNFNSKKSNNDDNSKEKHSNKKASFSNNNESDSISVYECKATCDSTPFTISSSKRAQQLKKLRNLDNNSFNNEVPIDINNNNNILQLSPKASNKRKRIGSSSSDSSGVSPNGDKNKNRLHHGVEHVFENTKNDPTNMFMGYNGAVGGNHSLATDEENGSSEDNNTQSLW